MIVIDCDGTISRAAHDSYRYLVTCENGQVYAGDTHFQGSATRAELDAFIESGETVSMRLLVDTDDDNMYGGLIHAYIFVAKQIEVVEIDLDTTEGRAFFGELFGNAE